MSSRKFRVGDTVRVWTAEEAISRGFKLDAYDCRQYGILPDGKKSTAAIWGLRDLRVDDVGPHCLYIYSPEYERHWDWCKEVFTHQVDELSDILNVIG